MMASLTIPATPLMSIFSRVYGVTAVIYLVVPKTPSLRAAFTAPNLQTAGTPHWQEPHNMKVDTCRKEPLTLTRRC